MKKIVLLFLAVTLFTGCENEAIDPALTSGNIIENPDDDTNNDGDGDGDTNNSPLNLSEYSFYSTTTVPFFGELTVNIDYSMGADNLINGIITNSPIFGQDIVTNTEIIRDGNDNTIQTNTFYLGELSDVTTITYNGQNQVTQITYNDIESDDEDYEYNYTYDGNEVTKTEVNSDIVTVYTFNNSNQLLRKESFEGDTSILLEILSYDNDGNVTSSVLSGEQNTNTTYNYDGFDNPLIEPFQSRNTYFTIGDEYDDQAGNTIAQFASTNNWIGINVDGSSFNFTISYDESDRILTRDGSFGDTEVSIEIEEVFTYAN